MLLLLSLTPKKLLILEILNGTLDLIHNINLAKFAI